MTTIVFSLYGSAEKYHAGLLQNLADVRKFYPSAHVAVVTDHAAPKVARTIQAAYQLLPAPHLHIVDAAESPLPLVACRLTILEKNCALLGPVLIRDADSRFTAREVAAVEDWLTDPAGPRWHTMRDHPAHIYPLQGGMLGYCGKERVPIHDMWAEWKCSLRPGTDLNRYSTDQYFMRDMLWPFAKDSCKVHDTFGAHDGVRRPFPPSETDTTSAFVGEVFSEQGQPREPERIYYLTEKAKL